MWKSLSEDARNSLIAVGAVLGMAAVFWAGTQVMRWVDLPDWAVKAGLVAIIALNVVAWVPRAWRWWRRGRGG